jgi:hypothetical protein
VAVLDHDETVATELQGLGLASGATRRRSLEAVSAALGRRPVLVQIAARHVEHGVNVEIAFSLPQFQEIDLGRVAEQPGGLVVERGRAFLELTDAERHPEALALTAEAAAGRYAGRCRPDGIAQLRGGCHDSVT